MKHINKEIESNYIARHEARVDSRAVVVDAESASAISHFSLILRSADTVGLSSRQMKIDLRDQQSSS